MKPSLLIRSHFAYFNVRTGMTLFTRNIARHLAKDFDVVVHTSRDIRTEVVMDDGITYLTGNHSIGGYDVTLGHAPHNRGCDIHLFDSINYRQFYEPDAINVFTTNNMMNGYMATGMVLNPIVHIDEHKTRRGQKITLVGMSEPKGLEILIALAKANPKLQFLGVRSGWQADSQPRPSLPNLEVMEQVDDMRKVWRKTKLLLVGGYEQYGKAGVEATINGIPTIAFDCLGSRESLGKAGIYVANKSVDDWQSALDKTLANYPAHSRLAKQHSKLINTDEQLEQLTALVKATLNRRIAS